LVFKTAGLFILSGWKNLFALDQGTTGTTFWSAQYQAKMIATVNQEHPQIYPKPGWVEHIPSHLAYGPQRHSERFGESQIRGDQLRRWNHQSARDVVMWDRASGKRFTTPSLAVPAHKRSFARGILKRHEK